MLIVALVSWILFTLPIGFIHPPVVSCKYYNGSTYLLKLPNSDDDTAVRMKRSISYPDEIGALTPETVDELPRALPLGMEQHFEHDENR